MQLLIPLKSSLKKVFFAKAERETGLRRIFRCRYFGKPADISAKGPSFTVIYF